jgi:integrase/recombinase XerD
MSTNGQDSRTARGKNGFLAACDWPSADAAMWGQVTALSSVLKPGGRGAKWRPSTLANVEQAYGEWLYWLQGLDPNFLVEPPMARVTRKRVESYVDSLKTTALAPSTVQMRLQRLGQMMAAASESKDFGWIFRAANRLRPASVRNKLVKMRPTYQLAQLGIDLMRKAASMPPSWNHHPSATFRNGLMIAFLAYRPIRLGNLASMKIDEHLIRFDGGFKIRFGAHETKQHRDLDFDMPESLISHLAEYLDIHRLLLAASAGGRSAAEKMVWISRDGRAMEPAGIREAIYKETESAFGVAINPNLFRDCAATTIAIDGPAHAHCIAKILGHSSMATSERHYNHANSIEAGNQYQAVLDNCRKRLARDLLTRGRSDEPGPPS